METNEQATDLVISRRHYYARPKTYRLRLEPTLADLFEKAAARRNIQGDTLLRRLCLILIKDNLIDAVLDDSREGTRAS